MRINRINWALPGEFIKPMADDNYSDGPYVHIRMMRDVYLTTEGIYHLDAIDAGGGFNEDLWSFETFDAAYDAIPLFNEMVARLDGRLDVEYIDADAGEKGFPQAYLNRIKREEKEII